MLETKLKIQLDEKTVELEKIFVSELGFTMIKTKNPDGTFTSYNVGKTDPTNNPFTNLILNNNAYIIPSRD
jgi:hypothetical protein